MSGFAKNVTGLLLTSLRGIFLKIEIDESEKEFITQCKMLTRLYLRKINVKIREFQGEKKSFAICFGEESVYAQYCYQLNTKGAYMYPVTEEGPIEERKVFVLPHSCALAEKTYKTQERKLLVQLE